MAHGHFELRKDEETGRLYWYGAEDGWKDATEIGESGVLTVSAEHFAVGAVLQFSEPDEGTLSYADLYYRLDNLLTGLKLWMVGWRDSLDPMARKQMMGMIEECSKRD